MAQFQGRVCNLNKWSFCNDRRTKYNKHINYKATNFNISTNKQRKKIWRKNEEAKRRESKQEAKKRRKNYNNRKEDNS